MAVHTALSKLLLWYLVCSDVHSSRMWKYQSDYKWDLRVGRQTFSKGEDVQLSKFTEEKKRGHSSHALVCMMRPDSGMSSNLDSKSLTRANGF